MTEHSHDPGPPDTRDVGRDRPGRESLGAENSGAVNSGAVNSGAQDVGARDASPGASAAARDGSRPLVGELVVRDPASATAPQPRWSRGIALARDRCVRLSANPGVVTAVTVGAGLAAGILRQALSSSSGAQAGRGRTLTVSGLVVHRIDVVHHHVVHQHVVHHPAGRPILPPAGPAPR